MKNKNGRKIEPWQIIVGAIAIAYIIFMWIRNDVFAIFAAMPKEQILPMILANIFVSLAKVAVIAGALLIIRWLIGKTMKK